MASGLRSKSAPRRTRRPARPPASCEARVAEPGRAPLLELRGIRKRFGAVQALYDVDFEVYAGEVVGLVGDNGAGKSSLIKAIAGIYATDSGEFRFEGRQVTIGGPNDTARLGISTVYQDLALCDNLDVVAVSLDRKSTRLNSSHGYISYAVFCLKKKKKNQITAMSK